MMKNCIPFELLSQYADNRCSASDRSRVETHLAECPDCKKIIVILKNSGSAIRSLGRPEMSEAADREFKRKLLERVRHKLISFKPLVAAVSASILLFIVGYDVLNYYLVESPEVTSVKGDVSVYSENRKKWMSASPGLRLARGDIVNVGADSYADISQADKYRARFKDRSRVFVARLLPRFIKGTAVYDISRGKALVVITEKFRGSRFIVNTPEAAACAYGTEFLVDVVDMTLLGVLEGKVRVESLYIPKAGMLPRQVMVEGGEATEVYKDAVPLTPRQLLDKEWAEMAEFYNMGGKTQVALLISNGKRRTRELLRPCPIFISGVRPEAASKALEGAIAIIDEAIKAKDKAKHIEGIRMLEDIMARYPDPSYEPQLLLFIGSYYNYLDMPDEAIASFKKVTEGYSSSTFASMGLYAAGIVCDERLHNKAMAQRYYDLVIKRYPASQESKLIREGLGKK